MSTATMSRPKPKACRVFGASESLKLQQNFEFDRVWTQPQSIEPTANARKPERANKSAAASTRSELAPKSAKASNGNALSTETLQHRDGVLAYVFDGSFEGILTAVYLACKLREAPADLVLPQNLQLRLGQEERVIETNMDYAMLVRRSIMRNFGKEVFEAIQCAAASDEPKAPHAVYQFTRKLLGQCKACAGCSKKGFCTHACQVASNRSVLDQIGDPLTYEIHRLRCSVLNEREYMVQFIRFEHMEGDVWFARCNPKAKVIPLLMSWFIARFNTQRFVIFDETHKISGVFDGRNWHLVQGDVTPPARVSNEVSMQNAWRRYFDSLCVDERYNPELQRQNMPKRFWKNLTEMQPLAS